MKGTMLALLMLCIAAIRAAATVPSETAQAAAGILPDSVWSQVVEIQTEGRKGSYPATFHGVVFDFEEVLWLYTPYDGTQSLSHAFGAALKDRESLGELLRENVPGYKGHRVIEKAVHKTAVLEVPNACFLRCVASYLAEALRAAEKPDAAFLCYYYSGRKAGHTVLVYPNRNVCLVYDPSGDEQPAAVEGVRLDDPVRLAKRLNPSQSIASARLLKLGRVLPAKKAGSELPETHSAQLGT